MAFGKIFFLLKYLRVNLKEENKVYTFQKISENVVKNFKKSRKLI